MNRDAEFEEIQTKNRFLSDKIQKLEKSLLRRSSGAVTVRINGVESTETFLNKLNNNNDNNYDINNNNIVF